MILHKAAGVIRLSVRETEAWSVPSSTYSIRDICHTLAVRCLSEPRVWRLREIRVHASSKLGGHVLETITLTEA
jgi:hypothetical protein